MINYNNGAITQSRLYRPWTQVCHMYKEFRFQGKQALKVNTNMYSLRFLKFSTKS